MALLLIPKLASAQTDLGGMGEIHGVGGTGTGGVRDAIENILFNVVSFVGLIAVVMIVVAGITLVVAGSNDTLRDKAKKTIIYVIVGIAVIALASAFVLFLSRIFT